ncbi:MAG: hypothetical protein M3Q11_07820 [Pseudomonadota bacterium]|nr:hypothetical protein [Pseudomonadota bacterium]
MYRSISLAALALGLFGIAACQDRSNVAAPGSQPAQAPAPGSSQPTPAAQTPAAASAAGALTLVQAEPGAYVADAAGSALYSLEGDVSGEGCIDRCLEVWPPMLVSQAQPGAAPGLAPNLVASTPRADGTVQVTYGNKPLYRYAGDAGAGRTAGHGVKDQWGQWSLVGADGEHLGVTR